MAAACSANELAEDTNTVEPFSNKIGLNEMAEETAEESFDDSSDDSSDEEADFVEEQTQLDDIDTNRMIIHHAYLQVNVENLDKSQQNMEKKVHEYGGYIVESSTYKEDDEHLNGNMTIRIPEEHFQDFLNETEKVVAETISREVTGQDVTEQYVDLEARLTSKQTVEERLLEFMKDAKKTEDLLKISSDLATVQEEIEHLVGKMKYLENQTAYSTINLAMSEIMVSIPGIDSKKLNTWDKTKKQLATSMNYILAAGSGFIVFLIGNLPIFIILAMISMVGYLLIKKRKKK